MKSKISSDNHVFTIDWVDVNNLRHIRKFFKFNYAMSLFNEIKRLPNTLPKHTVFFTYTPQHENRITLFSGSRTLSCTFIPKRCNDPYNLVFMNTSHIKVKKLPG